VAANVLAVVEITLRATSALVEYASNTRDASADRRLLANESRILIRLLERLQKRTSIADPAVQEWLEERQDLPRQFLKSLRGPCSNTQARSDDRPTKLAVSWQSILEYWNVVFYEKPSLCSA